MSENNKQNRASHREMLEVLAFELYKEELVNGESFEKRLHDWQASEELRKDWLYSAKKLLTQLSTSGIKVSVASTADVRRTIKTLTTIPASTAYEL